MTRFMRVMLTVSVSAVAAAAWGQEAPAKADVWPLVDEAAALIAKKDFAGAKAAAGKVIVTDPKQPIGYALLIHALEALGDDAAVIQASNDLAVAMPVGADVKKPDPLRQHQLWHYHANRHMGEALMRLKRYVEAADCFEAAGKLAFDAARPMDANQTRRWQIRMKDRQADALWEAGKREDAVTLRQQVIAKSDRDVRTCNNCVRVKASLFRNLAALGRADEAKTILDEAAADDRLDAVQKSWLTAAADAAPWKPPSPTGKLAATRTSDAFVIRSEGRFELRVNLATQDRYAMITQWYDLETDPLREVDLLDDNFFTLFKPHHVSQSELVDGQWKNIDYNRYVQLRKAGRLGVGYTKDQNAFEVLENTPQRVRYRYTNRSWPAETVTYTVYPDGRVAIGTHWSLVNPDKTIKINGMGYYTGVSGTVNWRTTIAGKTGMFGSPYIQGAAPFTMMHSNENYPTVLDATRADVAKCLVRPTSSYGNNTLFLAWFRSPVGVRFKPDEQAEADEACFIHIWPNDRNSFEAELPYVQDYQTPAKLDVTTGTLVTDDPGDYNHDGFNEAEGCYVVRAAKDTVALTIDGSQVTRISPVFKVLGGQGTGAEVMLDGTRLVEGETSAAQVDGRSGTALVRIVGAVSKVSKLHVRIFHADVR